MSYASLVLALLLLANLSPGNPASQATDASTEFVLVPLYDSVQVEAKCGQYLGYTMYTGVAEKCVSFNYEADDNIFIKTAAISTVKTEINNGKTEPTVQIISPSEIIIRISQEDYDKEKECLPEPEQK